MIVQTAVRDQEIVLGWGSLGDELVRSRVLTKLMPETIKLERGYCITYTNGNPSRSSVELHNWIAQEVSFEHSKTFWYLPFAFLHGDNCNMFAERARVHIGSGCIGFRRAD